MDSAIKASAGLLCLTIVVLCLTFARHHHPHTLKPEELFDPKRTNDFSGIEFDGQQRKVIVTNKAMLLAFAHAFTLQQERGLRGGTTYDSLFVLENGTSARAIVHIYEELNGFSVSIPRRSGLLEADPYYFNVRFSDAVEPQVRKVFEALTNADNVGKQIAF